MTATSEEPLDEAILVNALTKAATEREAVAHGCRTYSSRSSRLEFAFSRFEPSGRIVLPSALILRMATLLPFCQKPFGCAISHKNGVWQLIPRPKDCLCTCSLRYIGNGRAMRWRVAIGATLNVNQVVHGLIGIAMGRIAVPVRGRQLCSQLIASLPSFARGVLQLMGK
jgi:hypothetical protein